VGYTHPEVLVSTDWAAQHLNDSGLRLIEVDVDTTAYDSGHVAGAVGWNWQSQLNDRVGHPRQEGVRAVAERGGGDSQDERGPLR